MMRKIEFAVVAFLFALPMVAQYRTDYADLDDSETVRSMKEYVSYLSSSALKGRKAGSEGEKDAAKYIYRQMESIGLEMLCPEEGDVFGMKRENGDTLISRNVAGIIQGYDRSLNDHYIVIGARMDNLGVNVMEVDGRRVDQIYYGANGNASGVAMMLELAKRVKTNSILFRRSVIFVAFGASRQGFAGSWYFLNKGFRDIGNVDAMVNLDIVGGASDGFLAYTASNQDIGNLVDRVSGSLHPVLPVKVTEEPYPSDYRSFYAKGIPSVWFTTGKYVEHDTCRDVPDLLEYEDMEAELEYIYDYTRALSNIPSAPSFSSKPQPKQEEDRKVHAFFECDVSPSFLGHHDPRWFLQNWVYKYMRYPQEAVENGIQGKVTVYFEVNRKGQVKNVKVLKSVDPLLDAEAVRVVAASPDWKPARLGGKKVDSSMELIIEFRLEAASARHGIKLKR